MDTKRVLICGMTFNYGGMESYIMNLYRHIDREKIQFDFLYPYDKPIAYENEIKQMGGKIWRVPSRKKKFWTHYKKLHDLFKYNRYSAVYYQCTKKLVTLEVFVWAKRYGVLKRIVHSHSSQEEKVSLIHTARERLVMKQMHKYVNVFWACSDEAGKWMFPRESFTVIKNAIDVPRYCFDKKERNRIKKAYNAENKVILGTVGRIDEEKNPSFLVDVFYKFHEKNSNSIFFHIGDGALKQEIEEEIQKNHLENSYLLLGKRTDVPSLLNAMDVFLLPSKHEGFPISLVEAQANGLECIVSDHISPNINIVGLVKRLPLIDTEEWEKNISQMIDLEKKEGRELYAAKVREAGYDIGLLSQKFQNFIMKS